MISDDWLYGFICGEGCFTFGGGNRISPIFTITLKDVDLDLLTLIREKIKVGRITKHIEHKSCSLQVSSNDCYKLIEIFNEKLIGKKEKDFNKWKEGIKYWESINRKGSEEAKEKMEKFKPTSNYIIN